MLALICIFEFPPLVQASIIKSVLGNNYIDSIRKHLYQQCDKYIMRKIFLKYYGLNSNLSGTGKSRPFYSLYQLARLIILHHPIIAVVTYNFDKFLTIAIDILRENKEEFFTEKKWRGFVRIERWKMYLDLIAILHRKRTYYPFTIYMV